MLCLFFSCFDYRWTMEMCKSTTDFKTFQNPLAWESCVEVARKKQKASNLNDFRKLSTLAPPDFLHFNHFLELFTPCPLPFMIMAAAIHSLAYPRTKFACRTRRRWGTCAQKWTSSSNLSEVCSGSDACDNNMGSLTKWDRNLAQNIC